MAVKEISEIVSDLMKVGALIPEPKLTECLDAHEFLLDGVLEARTLAHALMFTPSEDIKNWDIARVDGQRQLVASLKEQGYISSKEAATMEFNLKAAIDYIKQSNWMSAVDMLQRYGNQIETSLPVWHQECASARKGDIISGIYYGINVHKEVDPTHKNIIWQDQIVALNRNGILTNEEADRLVKEVRW